MLQEEALGGPRPQKRLTVSIARCQHEVYEAQSLRYKVFAEEMGARVPGADRGTDCDRFDPYCDHLLVRDGESGIVVGTYRVLSGAQARRIGGFYSDQEFDLARVDHLRDQIVEVGRSCVHPDYRGGVTLTLLWAGIARYIDARGYSYIMGCASIGMADGGRTAAAVYDRLQREYLCPIEYRAFPRCPLPLAAYEAAPGIALPQLIKGYLSLGAYVCGAPAWDPDFNTADLMLLLPLARMNARYARRFLGHDR